MFSDVSARVLAGFELYSASARVCTRSTHPRGSPSHPPCLGHLILGPIGEFGGFGFFGVFLTSSVLFAAIIASIRPFCACVHVHNASALFLGLWGSSGRGFGLAAGKFDFLQSSWDFLMRSGVSVGFSSHLRCPACMCTRLTCPLSFQALLAHPRAVLRLQQVSPGFFALLTRLKMYSNITCNSLRACAHVRYIRLMLGPFWLLHARFRTSGK